MPELLVRNLDRDVVDHLKRRARENKRSLQSEVKDILEREARSAASLEQFLAKAARMRRKLSGRRHTDSGLLQAQSRER